MRVSTGGATWLVGRVAPLVLWLVGVAGASEVLSGCSSPIVGTHDAGASDTPPAPDAGGADALDAPMTMDVLLGEDAPVVGLDAPAEVDAPAAVDAPTGFDAPAAVDAPAALDAPAPVDAPTAVDAPAAVDAPVPVDAPPPVDAGPMCLPTQHLCGGVCRSNNSVATCGTSCTACMPPPDSTPTCDGTSCGFTCDPTFHACGTTCASDTSVTQCGPTCEVCPVPANSTPTCTAGACGFTCNTGYLPDGAGCTAAPPRPVAPLSGFNVSTRRPVFRWALPAGLTGAHIDVCTDRACTSIVYSADATGSTHTPTFNLPVGVVFWRLYGADATTTGTIASPTWQLDVPARSAPLSTAWGGAPDFNGDGYSDVVVDPSSVMEVRYGSATGIPTSASRTIAGGGGVGGWYGAAAIDVDGDGYTDLIGTVTDYVGVSGIHMRLFRGGSSGLSVTSQVSTCPNTSVASAGDLNADGYGDVVSAGGDPARVLVYLGAATGLPATPSFSIVDPSGMGGFGGDGYPNHGVAEAGDLDADGYSDLVVGQPRFVGQTGRAYVYRGGPMGPMGSPIILEAPVGLGFGAIVLGAGDVNGDGREDIVVGLCAGGGCFGSPRAAYVYHGTAAGVATTPSVTLTGGVSWFGAMLAAGADFSGDGYSDIVVSELSGPLHLYLGGPSSVPTMPSQSFATAIGNPIANVGDTNGDRLADLAVGTNGSWYLYPGASGGIATTPSVTVTTAPGGAVWFVRP